MSYLSRHKNIIFVVVLAVAFFIGTASFNYLSQADNNIKWSSPDETANYFFAREFSQTNRLSFFDKAGVIGDYLLMPRSVRNDFGFIKPVSFLGIILIYGSLAAILGVSVIPYLTPLFASFGIIIFYFLIKRLFSERIALWSAIILAFFPVYIYYTVRSMFHNVLFIVLVLAGLYLSVLALGSIKPEHLKFLSWQLPRSFWWQAAYALMGGGLLGLALITRTSEILWLGPALFFVWLFYARRLGLTKLVLIASGLFIPLVVVAYYNQILYNSFWYGGYNEMNRSLDDIASSGRALLHSGWGSQGLEYLRLVGERVLDNVFYFGLNWQQSLVMFRHYVIEMFPFLTYLGLGGFVLFIGQNFFHPRRKHIVLLLAWLAASAFLIFYYGSWQFNDNPDLSRHTIGNSYTRYWLPIYLGMIPLASLALVKVTRAFSCLLPAAAKNMRLIFAFFSQALVVWFLAVWSLNFVLFGSEEGLVRLYYVNQAEKINSERILALTEAESIIITRYHDKFFWPQRRVIMGTFPNDEIFTAAAKLTNYYPVYYYNFYFSEPDLEYLNSRRLVPYGLRLVTIGKFNSDFGLYRLERYASSEEAIK